MARLGKWLAGSLVLLLGMAAGYWSLRNGESTALETNASDTVLPSAATSEQGEPPALGVAPHVLSRESPPQPRPRSEQLGAAVEAGQTAAHRTISPPAAGPTEQRVVEPAAFVTLPPAPSVGATATRMVRLFRAVISGAPILSMWTCPTRT